MNVERFFSRFFSTPLFIIYIAVTIALGLSVYLFRRSRLANVALMLFSLALCFAGLETYYRFFYAESDGFGRLSKNFSDLSAA